MSAYFKTAVSTFLEQNLDSALAALSRGSADDGHDLSPAQITAWEVECAILQAALNEVKTKIQTVHLWSLLLEFRVPGRQKRLDTVILTDRGIIVIEFKVGAANFSSADKWQLLEYCWNLRDFHKGSHELKIAPILVATEADIQTPDRTDLPLIDRQKIIYELRFCNGAGLAKEILSSYLNTDDSGTKTIELDKWNDSPCEPTIDIIEAAKLLYQKHDVRQISDKYADNITLTTDRLLEVIQKAKRENSKVICFVTGVPGAGKTLVGLSTVHSQHTTGILEGSASYMSGNNPLLRVLRGALVRNLLSTKRPEREIRHEVSAFLRNVHEFTLGYLRSATQDAPSERVIIFDEAQRSWSATQVKKKNKDKQGFPAQYLNFSEPELILHVMERCEGWCVLIALVGGGQEIHDGEAGLKAWGEALTKSSTSWDIFASPQAIEGDHSLADQKLFEGVPNTKGQLVQDEALHLSVSKRSYRAQLLTEWVNHVLNGRPDLASDIFHQIDEFPIFLVRDLKTARKTLRDYSLDDQRPGLLASSGALRLRSEGVEVSSGFRAAYDYEHWFLNDASDIRSSFQLEVAATEFECQGLELDWVGLCWGGDFTINSKSGDWSFKNLKGSKWQNVNKPEKIQFLRNKYRVLLTRARQGLLIWIPKGDPTDPTNLTADFDATADYLMKCGLVGTNS